MLLAQGGRLLIQGVYFVLIGRSLGPAGFGLFMGALALVYILMPFANWGTGHILVMQVSRDPASFPAYWGNTLLTTVIGGTVFTSIAMIVGTILVPSIPLTLILTLALAELWFSLILDACGQAFQVFDRLGVTAAISILENGLRLIAAAVFMALTMNPTPQLWGVWYLFSALLASCVALVIVTRSLGRPRFVPSLMHHHIRDGWNFSVSLASATIYNDIDKTMLVRLATSEAAGIYAAAYRVIDMATAPLTSLLRATYAEFFRRGGLGIQGSSRYARRFVPFILCYGVVASLGLVVLAPITPYALGREYQMTVGAIQMLAILPALRGLYTFAANALTGAGHQGIRSCAQVGVAIFNVLLNLWLIPRYSWQGAVWSSLVSTATLVVLMWTAVWFLSNRSERAVRIRATEEGSAPSESRS